MHVCVCNSSESRTPVKKKKTLRGQCGLNANLANGGIREQRWRCRFQAKHLSDFVPHRMGWNSREKDKRMK